MKSVVKKKGRDSVRRTVSGWLGVEHPYSVGVAESAQQLEVQLSRNKTASYRESSDQQLAVKMA
jgi:hypothetical protein